MSTMGYVEFEAKTPEGWTYTDSEFELSQSYDLYAWLAGIRNYHNIPVMAELRGRPEDRESHEDRWDDSCHHWVLGSEVLEHVKNFVPIHKEGAMSSLAYHLWDRKGEPDGYSRDVKSCARWPIYQMDHPVVTHDNGYCARLWTEQWLYSKYVNTAWGKIPGGFSVIKRKVRPSRDKHLKKLARYAKRVGHYKVHAKWTLSPEQRRDYDSDFINEVHRLMAKYGEIRILLKFS